MCDVFQQLQPAGAFLRQSQNLLQPLRTHSDPIAVVGSCTDIDEALEMTLASHSCHLQQDEPVEDFLTSIRRGLDELVAEKDEDSDDEDEDEGEGCYYQAKENTYYSPDQKVPMGFMADDTLDLSDTSTASSSLFTSWHQQEDSDEEDEDKDDLIFQLEM